ncbi:transposase [Verrucomicrobium sp. BvORR034]|uniref:transposase n=1 Tax=Verrucomicrobium sp. BvORR034 TaxID=1396418 RepID=UPI000679BAC5|nr:transposase [Verrucomicrobium sp. BvORR034]
MEATPPPSSLDKNRLPKLHPNAYQQFSATHWTLCINDRRKGWLNSDWHAQFREVLLHALVRHNAACAMYCIMPDHAHLLIVGTSFESDQRLFIRYLKRHSSSHPLWTKLGIEWQKDSYDHVLRNAERGPQEFQNTARYIANNPVRAEIVEAAEDYPFTGVMLPGYATLRWHDERYWSVFWQLHPQAL